MQEQEQEQDIDGSSICEHKEAVMWNPYNKVVQCHRCGIIFEPSDYVVPIHDVNGLETELRKIDLSHEADHADLVVSSSVGRKLFILRGATRLEIAQFLMNAFAYISNLPAMYGYKETTHAE